MQSKYSDSLCCAAPFIRFAMDPFDHERRSDAIPYRNYSINDRKVSGFQSRKDDAVVLGRYGERERVVRQEREPAVGGEPGAPQAAVVKLAGVDRVLDEPQVLDG